MKLKYFKVIFGLFILVGSLNVWSADFTFRIPFQLTKLHDDVSHVRVECRLFPNANPSPDGQSRAQGYKVIDVSNNQLHTTVVLEVNATNTSFPPQSLKSYSCYFSLRKGQEGGAMAEGTTVEQWKRVKPGTQFVGVRNGTL